MPLESLWSGFLGASIVIMIYMTLYGGVNSFNYEQNSCAMTKVNISIHDCILGRTKGAVLGGKEYE